MTGPKDKPTRDADRFEELHDSMGRGLDDSLAVQGSDEDEGPAASADDEAINALDAGNGDPLPDDETDEEIPLPAETLARGSRRP
jgi:hypothetical protein